MWLTFDLEIFFPGHLRAQVVSPQNAVSRDYDVYVEEDREEQGEEAVEMMVMRILVTRWRRKTIKKESSIGNKMEEEDNKEGEFNW